jgi:hypothetical protein
MGVLSSRAKGYALEAPISIEEPSVRRLMLPIGRWRRALERLWLVSRDDAEVMHGAPYRFQIQRGFYRPGAEVRDLHPVLIKSR